tara:strand:+ start:485 stop:628 length:144 start_codon:yes stop_codon:yes gene_type:complete
MEFKITYIADTQLNEIALLKAGSFGAAEKLFERNISWNTIVKIELIR